MGCGAYHAMECGPHCGSQYLYRSIRDNDVCGTQDTERESDGRTEDGTAIIKNGAVDV